MIRFFEKQDKAEISALAADFLQKDYDENTFGQLFDGIVDGNEMFKGISVLHAGEYLGYCVFYITDDSAVISQLYIKPAFQRLKVAPQVFDFIESRFPGYKYKAVCPADNEIAVKVFTKRGYEIV